VLQVLYDTRVDMAVVICLVHYPCCNSEKGQVMQDFEPDGKLRVHLQGLENVYVLFPTSMPALHVEGTTSSTIILLQDIVLTLWDHDNSWQLPHCYTFADAAQHLPKKAARVGKLTIEVCTPVHLK
jgi:hypothetical protein